MPRSRAPGHGPARDPDDFAKIRRPFGSVETEQRAVGEHIAAIVLGYAIDRPGQIIEEQRSTRAHCPQHVASGDRRDRDRPRGTTVRRLAASHPASVGFGATHVHAMWSRPNASHFLHRRRFALGRIRVPSKTMSTAARPRRGRAVRANTAEALRRWLAYDTRRHL